MRQQRSLRLRSKITRYTPSLFLIVLSVFGVCMFVADRVVALENQFTVQLNVIGTDTDAPSVPTNVVATAISISQIDLNWNPSIDNTSVAGYVLFRDNLAIATTTSAIYNDTGLASATIYEYSVQAFDASGNYSAISATTSATTLTPPPPVATSTSSAVSGSRPRFGGIGESLRLETIIVEPIDDQSVNVRLTLNQPVAASLFWGVTMDYEMGSAAHIIFDRNHNFVINRLAPSSRYVIKVEMTSIFGDRIKIGPYFVQTKLSNPINPYDFSGISVDDGIVLSWRHSVTTQTHEVRLLRSEKGYPRDPFDGELIYEGVATAIKDRGVVVGKRYFYTLFSVSDATYSSGVIASVIYQRDTPFSVPEAMPEDVIGGDITFIQNQPLVPRDNTWRALSHQPISIIVMLPPEIQSIVDRVIISFNGRDMSNNAYLLSWNSALGNFTAEIDPGSAGVQSFVIEAYDSLGNVLYQRKGELITDSSPLVTVVDGGWLTIFLMMARVVASFILLFFGLLTFVSYLWY